MDYTTLGRSGLQVSRACLGALIFAEAKTGLCTEVDSRRIIDHFIDAGGSFIDRRRLLMARVGVHRRSGDRLAA
jgi:aryl-alcohol dehydrogenase-like predicted oxidoreductase